MEPEETILRMEFKKKDRVYEAGNVVAGTVYLTPHKAMNIATVDIIAEGTMQISWTEKGEKMPLVAEEKYLNTRILLWGQVGHSDSLLEGRHMFPFQFVLPSNLPSSFEVELGSVTYTLKAVVTTADGDSLSTSCMIYVLRDLDLNYEPFILNALTSHEDLIIRYGCLTFGTMSCMLSIPRSGYVPGESIRADVQVDNNSRCNLKSVKLKIQQDVNVYESQFHKWTGYKRKISERELLLRGLKKSNKRHHWSEALIDVPAVPPSRLDGCQHIDIKYELVLEVFVGYKKSLLLRAPIIIGSVPHKHLTLLKWELTYDDDASDLLAKKREMEGNDKRNKPKYKSYTFKSVEALDLFAFGSSPSQHHKKMHYSSKSNSPYGSYQSESIL